MIFQMLLLFASLSVDFCLSYTAADPINVILLSYHRSGSSFTGELLASHEGGAYHFEPLHYAKFQLKASTPKDYRQFMTRLMTCDQQLLDGLRHFPEGGMWIMRRLGGIPDDFRAATYTPEGLSALCQNSTIHVAKTIRLRLTDAAKLVINGEIPNLKIIHLVRDPRARLNSVRGDNLTWGNVNQDPSDGICEDMETDLRMGETLSSDIYKLIRYEDLVANTTAVVTDIYNNFLHLPVTPAIQKYIRVHTQAERRPRFRKRSKEYFSTFRTSNFDSNHWKKELTPHIIGTIQVNPKCQYVLDKLQYPLQLQ